MIDFLRTVIFLMMLAVVYLLSVMVRSWRRTGDRFPLYMAIWTSVCMVSSAWIMILTSEPGSFWRRLWE